MSPDSVPTLDLAWTTMQLEQNLSRILNTHVCHEVMKHLRQPNADFRQIANLLQGDPYVATKVVGIANLACRQRAHAIDSLQRAVQVLGMRQVHALMLSVMLVGPLLSAQGQIPKRQDLWRWVLACAIANDYLEMKLSPPGQADAPDTEHLIGGLVMGLGAIILSAGLGPVYDRVLGAKLRPMALCRREKRHLGATHYQVSLWALQQMQCSAKLGCGVSALLNPSEDIEYVRYRAVEVLGARIAGLEAAPARAWLADGLPRLGFNTWHVEEQMPVFRKKLKQIAGVFDVQLDSWEQQQQSLQTIMIEAGSVLQALVVDHLSLSQTLGLTQGD